MDDWRGGGPLHPVDRLSADHLALLAALGGGASIAAAATAAHLSLRTAHRRLAEAVTALGAASTTAAVSVVATRLRDLSPVGGETAAPQLVGRAAEVAAITDAVRVGGSAVVLGDRGRGTTAILRAVADALGCADRLVPGLATVDGVVAFERLTEAGDGPLGASVLASRIVRSDPRPIVVDDARLLDHAARALLLDLAAQVPVVVGGLVAHDPLASTLEAAAPTVRVEVGPLAPADAALLVRRNGVHHDVAVAEIVALAGGYPERLLVLARNADALDDAAASAVHLVRSDARITPAAALVGLAGEPIPEAALPLAAVEALDAAGFVDRVHGTIAPIGPVTRRVLASLADPAEVADAHRLLATVVDSELAAAEHLLAAGDDAEAHIAARRALGEQLSIAERARALAVAVRSAGDDAAVAPLLDAAVRATFAAESLRSARSLLAEVIDARPQLAEVPAIVVIDAGLLAHDGLPDLAAERLDAALAAPGLDRVDEVRLRTIRWAIRLASGRDGDGLRREAAELEPVLAAEAPDLTSQMMPGIALAMQGDPSWPQHLLPLHAAAIRQVADQPGTTDLLLALATEVIGFFLGVYGDLQGAVDLIDRAIDALRAVAADGLAADLAIMRAYTAIAVHGPTDDRLDVLRDAIPRASSSRQRSAGFATVAMSEAERGRFELAFAAIAQGRAEPEDPIGADALHLAEAMVHGWNRDAGRVLELLETADPEAGLFNVVPLQAWAQVAWARLDLGLAIEPLTTPIAYPGFTWVLDQVEAVHRLVAGETGPAVDAARRAVDRPGTAARDHLLLRWLLGEALVQAGQIDEAMAVLEPLEADALGRDLGPLVARVQATLRRAGRTPGSRRRPPAGAGAAPGGAGGSAGAPALSAREVEVLDLVRQGFTSKQIADRLHVAPSSVDTAIKRARVKLGAKTRREAAAAIHP